MYIFSRWLQSSMIQKSSKISFWAFIIVMHYTTVMITYHKIAWNYYLAMLWYLYAYHVAHYNESYICHTCKKGKNVFEGRKGMICCLLFHSIFLMWTFACVKKEWYKQFFTFSKRLLTKARQNIKQSAESKAQIKKM